MAAGSKLAEAFVTLRLDKSLLAKEILGVKGMVLAAVGKMGTEGGKKLMRFMARGVKSGASMVMRALKKVISPWSMLLGGVGLYAGARMVSAFIRPFAAFEAEMDKSLAILSGALGREEEIEATTRMLAKRYAKSHEEMAKSIFYFASAGLDASKTLAIFENMTKFAVAGSFDMATATDMMTDSLSALGWAADDAVQYGKNMVKLADMITKGNMIANTTIQQLAEALMNRGAGAMTQFGIAAEEGLGALLALADKGFAKGGQAGMQFAMLLEGLAMAWKNHADEMKAAGIYLYDTEGNFRSLTAILDEFNQHLGPLSTEARNEFIMGTLAMDKRASRVLGVLRDSAGLIRDKFVPALKDAGGSVDELANKNMVNLLTVWRRFKATIVDMTITVNKRLKVLWEGITEVATALMDKLVGAIDKKALQWLQDWADDLGESLKKIAAWVEDIKIGDLGKGLSEVFKITFEGLGSILLSQAKMFGRILLHIATRAGEGMAMAFAKLLGEVLPDWMGAAGIRGRVQQIEWEREMGELFGERETLVRLIGKEWKLMMKEVKVKFRMIEKRYGMAFGRPAMPAKPKAPDWWWRQGRQPPRRTIDRPRPPLGRPGFTDVEAAVRSSRERMAAIYGTGPFPEARVPFRPPGRQLAVPPKIKVGPEEVALMRQALVVMRQTEGQAKATAFLAGRLQQALGITGRKEVLARMIAGTERKLERARRLPTGEQTALENLHAAIQKDIMAAHQKKQIKILEKQLEKMDEAKEATEKAGDKVVAAVKEIPPAVTEEMP